MLEKLFSRSKSSIINLIPLDLGGILIKIPVADIRGTEDGPTIVVTAGMDGDEYTGIEAAYRIIDEYSGGAFAGRLIVVPIVNIPGFEAECSHCPIDGQFPKSIFPGSADGSPTERIVAWLAQNYLDGATLWIDLHSGAITEGLNPFAYLYETDSDRVDALTQKMIDAGFFSTIVLGTASWGSKPARLSKMGCAFVQAESGARGKCEEEDVMRHVRAVKTACSAAGMTTREVQTKQEATILRDIEYVVAPRDGIWRCRPIGGALTKGDEVGELCDLDGSGKKIFYAPCSGVPLWWKETLHVRKGEILLAIAK
jgi:predicted deacylase